MIDAYSVAQRLSSLVQDKSLTDMEFLKEYCSEVRACLSEFNISYNLIIYSSEYYHYFPECADTSFCDKKSIVKFNDLTIDIRSSLELYNNIFIGLLNYAFVQRAGLRGIELVKSLIQSVTPSDTDFMITDSYTDRVLVKTKRVGDKYGSTISLIDTSSRTEESKYKIYSSSKDILKVFVITPMDLMDIILTAYNNSSEYDNSLNCNNSFIGKLQKNYDKYGILYTVLEEGIYAKFIIYSTLLFMSLLFFIDGINFLGFSTLLSAVGIFWSLHFMKSYFSDHCIHDKPYLLHNAFTEAYEKFMDTKNISYEAF